MTSKEKIRNTVVCYWSAEDESFIAESSMIPHVVIGVGETDDEAKGEFDKALDDVFDEVTADNVAGYKMGRPAKGYVAFNTNLRPSSRKRIQSLASELDVSQGEAVDFLVFFHECKSQEKGRIPEKNELVMSLDSISEKIEHGFEKLASKIDKQSTPADQTARPIINIMFDPAALIVQAQRAMATSASQARVPRYVNNVVPFPIEGIDASSLQHQLATAAAVYGGSIAQRDQKASIK